MTSRRTRRRLISRLRAQGIKDAHVLAAIENVPRHLFISEALAHKAYEDTALPIGNNQTISQPYIVARMTELLFAGQEPVKKVLEIGTGSGYQSAILSQMTHWLFTIERIASLQQQAKDLLPQLGYRNISYLNDDGFAGWPSNQPFDRIIVTAAPPTVPVSLLEQLDIGGRLVIPVGDDKRQSLRLISRTNEGFSEEVHELVRFVPMLSGRC